MNYLVFLIFNFIPLPENLAFDEYGTLKFFCQTQKNQTIRLGEFCDGYKHCDDGSDEIYHSATFDPPPPGWQRCFNNGNMHVGPCLVREEVYIRYGFTCDIDCEEDLETNYRCQNGLCVPRSTICNGVPCDGCKEDHGWKNGVGFKCLRDGRECILPQQLLHDDISDCDGGTDLCFGFKYPMNTTTRGQRQSLDNLYRDRCFQCLDDVMLIPTSRVCDDIIDCSDLSDECLCEGKINPDICDNVVLYGQVSNEESKTSESEEVDGKDDDEIVSQILPIKHTNCEIGSVDCSNGSCIPRTSVCDGIKDCENDEKFEYCQGTVPCKKSTRFEKVCRCEIARKAYVCQNNYGTACDGVADCPTTHPMWGNSAYYEDVAVEDECYASCSMERSDFDCQFGSDFVHLDEEHYFFRCMEFLDLGFSVDQNDTALHKYDISGSASGDLGYDESDIDCVEDFTCDGPEEYVRVAVDETCECLSNRLKYCEPKHEHICKQTVGEKKVCVKRKEFCSIVYLLCDVSLSEINCKSGRCRCGTADVLPDLKEFLSHTSSRILVMSGKTIEKLLEISRVCDGLLDCKDGSDEANCEEKRFQCDVISWQYVSISKDEVCDGTLHCYYGLDELDERCNATRFSCNSLGLENEFGTKKKSIDRKFVCDGVITCEDSSDEMNCNDGRFYCENGVPLFVKGKQKFDGQGDCSDWSDECPLLNQTEATNVFSSRYEMIANPILRGVVWVMGILSICGNGGVVFVELKKLKNYRQLKPVAIANRLLVLNLAVSDGIMGVYLIALGIVGLTMQGQYCSRAHLWRSSSTCTTLGILSVLSSETSVMTMVLLTCCRLYAIAKPFMTASRPTKRVVYSIILLAWSVSLSFALLPLAPQLSAIFISHARLEDNLFVRSIETELNDGRKLFATLLTYDMKPNVSLPVGFSVDRLSWKEMESFGEEFFKHQHFGINRTFGYYSTDSVCIPKFFVTTSDHAWIFSFLVNLFNFCAFIFVAFAHIAIYLHSRKGAEIRTSQQDKGASALQRKILRLIITDFCCWIPICVIAFCKLAGANVSNLAYAFAAIVLLPINSALNPLLYSSLLDILYKKIADKFKRVEIESIEMETKRTQLGSSSSERAVPLLKKKRLRKNI